jgi:hypothetical protein
MTYHQLKGGIDLSKTRLLPDYELGGRIVPHKFVGVSGRYSVWASLETGKTMLAEPFWLPGEAAAAGIGSG